MDRMKRTLRKCSIYVGMVCAPAAGFLFVRTLFAPTQSIDDRIQAMQKQMQQAAQNAQMRRKARQEAQTQTPTAPIIEQQQQASPQPSPQAKGFSWEQFKQRVGRKPVRPADVPAPSPVRPSGQGQDVIAVPVRPVPADAMQVPQSGTLLEFLEVSTDAEGIAKLQQIEQQYAKIIMAIYLSLANAINSSQFQKAVEAVAQQGEVNILDPEEIVKLNQMSYDKVFELKKRYYEAVRKLKESCEPALLKLDELIRAKVRRAGPEAIRQIIPSSLKKPTDLESIPKDQLIKEIQQMKLD